MVPWQPSINQLSMALVYGKLQQAEDIYRQGL